MGLCDKGGVFDRLTFHACLWDLNLKGLWLGTWEPKLQKPNNWQIYIYEIGSSYTWCNSIRVTPFLNH